MHMGSKKVCTYTVSLFDIHFNNANSTSIYDLTSLYSPPPSWPH